MNRRPINGLPSVLLVGPNQADLDDLEKLLQRATHAKIFIHREKRLESALARLRKDDFQVILVDLALTDGTDGRGLASLARAAPGTPLVGISDPGHAPPRLSNGERIDHLVRGRFEYRALADLIEHLLARKVATEASFAERERAEVTLNSIGDAVLCTDTLGRVTFLNPVAEKITGWSSARALGRPGVEVFRIIDGDTREPVDNTLQMVIRSGKPETCPQYLMLTRQDMDRDGMEGSKYVCSPPPRDVASQEACWRGIEDGSFDVYSSDHCPYRFDDSGKLAHGEGAKSFRWIPNGIPGVETRLPILFSEGVGKGRININQFVALTATNHAKIYGLYPRKGTIAIGADADIAIWDPDLEMTITQSALHHGAGYTPYEGLAVKGWPVTTIVRGSVVVRERELVSAPSGAYLGRELHHSGLKSPGA